MNKKIRFLKKILVFSLMMSVITAVLGGCGEKTKTLTMGGVSIDLPDDFELDTSKESIFNAYAANDVIVFAAVDETTAGHLDGLTLSSLKSYAEYIYATRKLGGEITVTDELTQRDNYYYFSFTKAPKDGYSVYCLFEKDQCYWLCMFSCNSNDYSMKDILKWADTIKID